MKLPRAPMIFGESQSNEEGYGDLARSTRLCDLLTCTLLQWTCRYSLSLKYTSLCPHLLGSSPLRDPPQPRSAQEVSLPSSRLSLCSSMTSALTHRLSTILRSLSTLSSLRLASAISLYSTLYRLLLPSLTSFLPTLSPPASPSLSLTNLTRRTLTSKALPPFFVGVAASPAMLLEGRGQRRVTIALYALTRAVHGLVGVAGSKRWISKGMREGRWWWGGHLVFA